MRTTTSPSSVETLDRAFRRALHQARHDQSLGAGQKATLVHSLEILRDDHRWGQPLYPAEPISQAVAALQQNHSLITWILSFWQGEAHPFADTRIELLGADRALILDYLDELEPREIPGPYSQARDAEHLEELLAAPATTPGRIDYKALKERIDIVEYIGRFTRLRKEGGRYKALCLFHSEKTPSFVIYPNTRSFYCFGCQASGDVIDFARMTQQALTT